MIEPTVGRIVWYRGADAIIRAAIIAAVNGPFNLNLYVFGQHTQDPECGPKDSVTHADPEQEPSCLQSWHWMPYQIGQAKKVEAKDEAASLVDCATPDRSYLRASAIEMALRTSGVRYYDDALKAAGAYMEYIEGGAPASIETKTYADGATATGTAPLPGVSPDGAPALPPHQQRVVYEKAELDGRLKKLAAFFSTPVFEGLDRAEKDRMNRQYVVMTNLSGILGERIDAF